jgi:hypothetical protein
MVVYSLHSGLFKYAPMFQHYEHADGKAIIGPMTPLPPPGDTSTLVHQWEALIGFNPYSMTAGLDFGAAYDMSLWARTGRPLVELEALIKEDTGRSIPHGSVLDFGVCPVSLTPVSALVIWLASRSVPYPLKCDRELVVRNVERVVTMSGEGNPLPIVDVGDLDVAKEHLS